MVDKLIKTNIILGSLTNANIFAASTFNSKVDSKKKELYRNEKRNKIVNNLKEDLNRHQINLEFDDINSIFNNIFCESKDGKYSFIKDKNNEKLTNFNKIAGNFGNKQFSIIFFENGAYEVSNDIYNENDKDNVLTKKILELTTQNKTFYVLSFTGSCFIGFDYSKEEAKKESNHDLDRIKNLTIKSKNIDHKPGKEEPKEQEQEQEQEQGKQIVQEQKGKQQKKEISMEKLKKLKPGKFNFVINDEDKDVIVDKENKIIRNNTNLQNIDQEKVKALFTYCQNDLIDFKNLDENNYSEKAVDHDENSSVCCFNSYIFKIINIDGENLTLELIDDNNNQNTSLDFSNGEIYIGFLRNIMFQKIKDDDDDDDNKEDNDNNSNENKQVYFRFLLINDEEGYGKFKKLDKDTTKLISVKRTNENNSEKIKQQNDLQQTNELIKSNENENKIKNEDENVIEIKMENKGKDKDED